MRNPHTKNGPISRTFVAESDLLLLAVPVRALEALVREIGPWTRRDGLVVDITSLKEQPVQWMLRHCNGEVIGSHPLFGPSIDSLKDQIVFVCPARSTRWIGWFRAFFQGKGAKIIDMDARHHDHLMAHIQALRHLLLLCFGRTLKELDFDLGSDLPRSGPWFQTLVGLLANQMQQAPDLYADITIHNPMATEVFDTFLRNVTEVSQSLTSRDRQSLLAMLEETASYLKGEDLPGGSQSHFSFS
jgi:prephenate dehydrogenase